MPRLGKATRFTHSPTEGKPEPAQSDHRLSAPAVVLQLRKTVKYLLRTYLCQALSTALGTQSRTNREGACSRELASHERRLAQTQNAKLRVQSQYRLIV